MLTPQARFAFLICLVLPALGCTDGPFFQMKKLNPYIQSQWRKDRQKAVVFSQRVDEMRLLQRQFASMPDEEQTRWVRQLDSILKTETSPEIRREAVLALERVSQRQDAVATIASLSKDKNEKVRLAVASALGNHDNPQASSALMAMAQTDASTNVRLVATKALGKHPTEEVRAFLASRLEDRSPAMQYQASLALKDITGKDYGGDIESWKRFLQGEDVPEPRPSLADSLQSMLPTFR